MAWSSRNGNYWQSGVTLTKVSETDTTIKLKYTALFRSDYRISVMSSITWSMSMSGGYTWSSSSGGEAEGKYITSENDSSVTLYTKEFTINKTTSSQTITAKNTVEVTSVSSGTKTATASYTVPAKTSYTIKYNVNGGSSSAPSNQTKWHGTALTLSSTKPTRTGYTFKNWNTKKDGSGTSYSSGGNYTSNSSITLYAQWTENKLTVNYYKNGANYAAFKGEEITTDLVYSVQFYYDNSYPNGLANVQNVDYIYLSRTGYAPTGYWGTSSSGGTLVNQNTSFNTGQALAQALGSSLASGNASVNIYAQWQENAYVLTYDSNGGFGEMDSQTIEWGELFKLPNNTFKRTGYKFLGWNAYRNSDNTWYATGQGWKTEDEIIANGYSKKLYEDQCELTFDTSWIRDDEEARLYTMYAVWELFGGIVYIDNGSAFEPYLPYVDNGTSWDVYLVYIDDGTSWNMIS